MSKQVTFNLPESIKNIELPKREWPGSIPRHIAEKFGTPLFQSYYGKTTMAEDDLPAPLCRLNGFPGLSVEMSNLVVDTEAPKPKPFTGSKAKALARIQKEIAEMNVSIAQHQVEIAGKLELIESLRNDMLISTIPRIQIEKLRIWISIYYCQIEIQKLEIQRDELIKADLQDKFQEIQHWTED